MHHTVRVNVPIEILAGKSAMGLAMIIIAQQIQAVVPKNVFAETMNAMITKLVVVLCL